MKKIILMSAVLVLMAIVLGNVSAQCLPRPVFGILQYDGGGSPPASDIISMNLTIVGGPRDGLTVGYDYYNDTDGGFVLPAGIVGGQCSAYGDNFSATFVAAGGWTATRTGTLTTLLDIGVVTLTRDMEVPEFSSFAVALLSLSGALGVAALGARRK